MKTGIELEYWIINEEGKLSDAEKLASKLDFAEQEFVRPLFEIKTRPHTDLDSLRAESKDFLQEAIAEAQKMGLGLVPLGTPLNSPKIEMNNNPRSQIQQKIVGEKLDYAKRVAGTHFHFEQNNPEDQINKLIALDPALGILSSSKHYNGEKIAFNARNFVYRYKCYEDFPKHADLWEYKEKAEDWKNEEVKRYEELKEEASKNGVDPEEFENHFSPSDSVWTPVRLRENLNTVEWRALDTAPLSEVLDMLEQVTNLMEENFKLPKFQKVERISRSVIKSGLTKENSKYLRNLDIEINTNSPSFSNIKRQEFISRQNAQKFRKDAFKKLRKDLKNI